MRTILISIFKGNKYCKNKLISAGYKIVQDHIADKNMINTYGTYSIKSLFIVCDCYAVCKMNIIEKRPRFL